MTIAEESEKFDIPQDTLRYYERIGLLPRVNRSKSVELPMQRGVPILRWTKWPKH